MAQRRPKPAITATGDIRLRPAPTVPASGPVPPWRAEPSGAILLESEEPVPEPPPPSDIPPPAPPPVLAYDLRVEEIGPFSAVVHFATSEDVQGVVGFGREEPVAFASDGTGREHRIALTGLVPSRSYRVSVISHDGDPKPQIALTTPARPANPHAAVREGRLELDGQPFFPVASYGACGWNLDNLLAASVNVFSWELGCGPSELAVLDSIDALAGRAYWTLPWPLRDLRGDGQIGYTQPDEPDGQGLSPLDLPAIDVPGEVTFVTFTQHFSPGAGELPWQTAGYYEDFVPRADVLGFDVYPLQGLCRPDKLALVHDAQADLVELGGGKPTFQWIEVAPMNCRDGGPEVAITPETIRAEMLLAVAGGATGLGLFPAHFDASLAPAIRATLDEIEAAWPMLLTPRVPVAIGGEGAETVRASARSSGGGTLVVVANAALDRRASVELHVPGLGGRQLRSLGGELAIAVDGDLARVELAPLEAHILIAGPSSPVTARLAISSQMPEDMDPNWRESR